MRIDSSVIGMESARRYTSSKTQYNRFVLKDYHGGMTQANNSLSGGDVSEEEAEAAETRQSQGASRDYITDLQERVDSMRRNRVQVRSTANDYAEEFRQYTTRYIFMLLFGDEKTKELLGEEETSELPKTQESAILEFTPMTQVHVTAESHFVETESVSFSSKGTVTTADGRQISFSLGVSMSRAFMQHYREEYDMVRLQQKVCDPLVINFDSDVAELSDQKFFFDIDADGSRDEVSMLSTGSGYLALDRNGDGRINDGNELFGPLSGNGFQDLAEYDEDGDGWIDEDDSVWSRLKIWCKDENGQDILYTLRDKGVGAISLQNAATDFALNDEQNVSKGYIRSTGIFLYENGNVGTVQHLDLVQ